MGEFSEVLRRLRERAGYPTARKFFMSVGGRAALKCTYAQYLNIESGRSSPKPKVMQALVAVLRIWEDAEKSRGFCRAYLASHFGPGEFVDFLMRSLRQVPPIPGSAGSQLRKAMAANVEARSVAMPTEKMQLIRSSPAHFWAFHVVNDDSGAWTAEKAAQALGMPVRSVRRAMAELAAQGLLIEGENGSFTAAHRGKYIAHHPTTLQQDFEVSPNMPQFQRLWEHMGRQHGKTLCHQALFFRASESELRGCYPFLAQAVHGLDMYETNDKGHDTSFVVAEVVVRRLMPF